MRYAAKFPFTFLTLVLIGGVGCAGHDPTPLYNEQEEYVVVPEESTPPHEPVTPQPDLAVPQPEGADPDSETDAPRAVPGEPRLDRVSMRVDTDRAYDVEILRDTWGVPHIFGKTDADASYGLAYAQCEDDFPTVEDVVIMTRSKGGALKGTDAAAIDYIVHLLGAWDVVNAQYDTVLSPETRAICEAYADGVNDYASEHPNEVRMADVFPVTGKDIVTGFVFRSPFFYGLDSAVLALFGPNRPKDVSEKRAANGSNPIHIAARAVDEFLRKGMPTGSNTFSVAPSRTPDGSTYLNVNSHQPWEGPVAWYEAHVHSEEGWDAVGGTFPGAPLILHGHNRRLGWAHTVNSPDLIDIYVLTINPDNPDQYRFDGEWRDFEIEKVAITTRLKPDSPMTMTVHREVVRSVHGPVLRQDHGVYAIRYAGMNEVRQVEQWYRMNKAQNKDEWLEAMQMRAIASLNCGYADADGNILYLYNASVPQRVEGYDWELYLPGDTSETLWDSYIPFDTLPMVVNPPSGFVQNCNSTPYLTTFGAGNPDPASFSKTLGIETNMTNRALRALEQFEADDSITFEEFEAYKYDMAYSEESFAAKLRTAVITAPAPEDPLLREAVAVFDRWDLGTNPANTSTALGVMTALPLNNSAQRIPEPEKLWDALRDAAMLLTKTHGRLDPPWEAVNRLHRGTVDLGLGGGPDILHAVYGNLNKETGQYIGRAGDCYVMLVKWDADGNVSSHSIHQYGAATSRPNSEHHADQAPLFAARELKPVWFDEADIRANLERAYRPGHAIVAGTGAAAQ